MRFIKFLYNTDAADGAGEGEITDPAPAATEVTETPASFQIPLSDLEALGFKSLDELKAHFNKPADPTEEEKAQAAQREKADFLQYSTKEGLLNVDEYQGFESLKAKADRDLTFENFATEFREDNPDAEDYEVQEAYNNHYHIDSENATLKKRGEKLIAKDAAELRAPVQSKYDNAFSKYKENRQLEATVPQWNKLVDETVGKLVPEKLKVFEKEIDGEKVSVEIELSTADREEIAKKFKMNVKAYNMFAKGETEQLNADLSRKINGYIKEKYEDQIFEKAVAIGKTKGSNIGATAPFPMIQGATIRSLTPQSDMDEIRASHATAKAKLG